MIRALLSAAAVLAAALAFAVPPAAAGGSGFAAAPVDVFAAGPLYTDCPDSVAQEQTPSIPEPPKPSCVSCPEGYHCAHNPERCVAD